MTDSSLLSKLDGFRKGGEVSDRQWRDVLVLLDQQNRRLDQVYLQEWARTLGVDDLLAKALDDD